MRTPLLRAVASPRFGCRTSFDAPVRELGDEAFGDHRGVVRTAVVDDDDVQVLPGLGHHAAHGFGQQVRIAVARHDHRDLGLCGNFEHCPFIGGRSMGAGVWRAHSRVRGRGAWAPGGTAAAFGLPCHAVPPQPILFCSHVVEWGGAETVLADLLGALDRSRFAPHLACPAAGPLPDRAHALGVPVHALSLRGGSAFTKLCSLPRAARELRHIAREIGAPLVYANSMIAGYAAVLAQGPQLACLWHLHIVTQSRVARFALRRAHAVITPSRAGALAVDARMAASKRLTVVPNGVAAAFFTARGTGLREALGLPPGAGLVGMFGRLDPHKGHEVLLRAMARLPDSAHAVIVGGEAFADSLARVRGYPERLRAVAAEGGLEPRVHFLGHRDDIAALMSQCDVVAVPSTALESAPHAPSPRHKPRRAQWSAAGSAAFPN
jgi:hypothetical protein